MWPPGICSIAASVALLFVASATAAQRTSPQFSFPSPNSQTQQQGNQFSSDLFVTNNQDLSLLSQSQSSSSSSSSNSAGPQSLFASLGAPQSTPLMPEPQFGPLPALLPQQQQLASQLVAQSPSQLQQTQPQQRSRPQEQPQAIQLTRPSLSLTSLSLPQQQSQQQSARASFVSQQQQQQQQTPATTNHQHSSRQSQHQTPVSTSSSTSSSRSVSSSSSATSSLANSAQQRPAATAATPAGNSQLSVESARKFEANSASLAASSGQTFNCPDSFGFFRHHKSCDKYWACENGTATLKLCGNGLMFDDSDPKRENCAYPFSVDCGADRTDLEPPISTQNCPRLYGLFSDTSNCRVFYSCWNGEASKYECPPGLAYDSEQRVCVWADLVDRCDQSEVSDGFVCPDPTEADQPGHYTRHPHVTDCRKFYVCIEGVARPYGCSFGTVFNVDSLQCDEPENVSGCEKYYGDLDPKLAKKLARENAQGNNGGSASTSSSRSTSASNNSSPKETTAA